MDLTIPYTFYPVALPRWIAWTLFTLAILGGGATGLSLRSRYGWLRAAGVAIVSTLGCLFATVIASMVITFFVHDQ
jgi:hypothetical protein